MLGSPTTTLKNKQSTPLQRLCFWLPFANKAKFCEVAIVKVAALLEFVGVRYL
jgi:hypothetical protein